MAARSAPQSPQTYRVRHLIGVCALYVAATVVMTLPYVNWHALASASYPGDARLMIWTLAWDDHAWLHHLPILHANMFFPDPAALTYTDPLFGIALFTLPIYAITNNPVLAYNLIWLLAFVLNGLAMHVLAFRVTRSHPAALVGGLTYAFSFYMMLHAHAHLSLIWVWLLPLSFVLLERWVARPTVPRILAFGVTVLLQMLASWYLAIIILVALAIVASCELAFAARGEWVRRLWQAAAVALCGIAVLWPLAAPYRHSLPAPSVAEVRGFSADWASYLLPPQNTLIGQWWMRHVDQQPRWIWGELTMFVGWIASALAVTGIAVAMFRRHWRVVVPFGLLMVLGVALSFGPQTARHGWPTAFDLLSRLPAVSAFRVPARFGLLVLLATSMFAAVSIAELHRRIGPRIYVVLALLVPAMLAEWFVVQFPGGKPRSVPVPAIYRYPAVQQARAIVSLPDYFNEPQWFSGADYLLFSTAHWRPIANGYGRGAPPEYRHEASHLKAFPGPNNAKSLRELGIDLIVLHGDRIGPAIKDLVSVATSSADYALVAQDGNDYLLRVRELRAADR
jgi:hypothetical protein